MTTYLSIFFIFLFSFFNLFGVNPALAIRQLIFFLIGSILFFLIKRIGREIFLEKIFFFYLSIIFFLVLVFFIGDNIRGARRWIDFGFFNFQPSEFFKIFLIVYLAKIFSEFDQFDSFYWLFIKSLLIVLLPLFLVYKQPDLGTTIVIIITFLSVSFFSPIPKKYYLQLFIIFIFLSPLIWHFLADYQKARLISFLNPEIDRQGVAYNMIQSIIAIGAGGFFGKGLGRGSQTKLFFLPESHTDFAFASLVEQFGFFGGVILLILYGFFIFSLLRLAKKYLETKKFFDFYYLIGLTTMIFIQILINIGMNLGLAPVTGIPLPIISYGGSSLIALLFGLSLIEDSKKTILVN